jgi:hypothetical protein
MTTRCGASTPWNHGKHICNFPLARRTGFSHTAGALYFRRLRPFAENGEAPTPRSPFPLPRLVSKHRPSVKKSSIWRTKKSPIWGMCSEPPRYYNLINR